MEIGEKTTWLLRLEWESIGHDTRQTVTGGGRQAARERKRETETGYTQAEEHRDAMLKHREGELNLSELCSSLVSSSHRNLKPLSISVNFLLCTERDFYDNHLIKKDTQYDRRISPTMPQSTSPQRTIKTKLCYGNLSLHFFSFFISKPWVSVFNKWRISKPM
jgi:hypothetical protein